MLRNKYSKLKNIKTKVLKAIMHNLFLIIQLEQLSNIMKEGLNNNNNMYSNPLKMKLKF